MQRGWLAGSAAVGVLAAVTVVGSGGSIAQAAEPSESTIEVGPAPLVYVTNSANFGDGAGNVARFTIDSGGRLSFADKVEVGDASGARSMVFTADLRFAYLANTLLDEVVILSIGVDGRLERLGAVATPGPFAMAIAPDGDTIYVSNIGTPMVSPFAVNELTGQLKPLRPEATGGASTKGVAVTPDGRFLYASHGDVRDTEPSVLTGFALEPDGEIGKQVAEEQIGTSGAETVVTPDGRFVYVVHQVSDDVHGFRIDANGNLTPVPSSPVPAGRFAEGAAISPDGRRLYVAAVGVENGDPTVPGQVLGFTIGPDGELIETVPRVTMTSPIGIGLTPNGRFMYVSDFTDSVVNTFAVGADGHLALIQTVKSAGLQPAFHSVNLPPATGPLGPAG